MELLSRYGCLVEASLDPVGNIRDGPSRVKPPLTSREICQTTARLVDVVRSKVVN